MNKSSVKKRKPVKANRKVAARPATSRKTVRAATAKATSVEVRRAKLTEAKLAAAPTGTSTLNLATVSVVQVMARAPALHTHKYRVGQTVFYTSSPITRPGASGSYQVVRLLPSDGDDYQYRIKNPGEAFERVAKESQLDLEH
jgi:hypothetical protein